jgi:uncharacterized membrane protein YphA (DoxX/SURF4 family)
MNDPSSPALLQTEPASAKLFIAEQIETDPPIAPWPPMLRVAFRFCFVYFGLFCLSTQVLSGLFNFPLIDIPEFGTLWPLRQIVTWTATHIFRVHDLVFTENGSGDRTIDWILIFVFAIFAIVATIAWSLLDRRRAEYSKLHAYFRLFIRFALAGQMLFYGLDKAFPIQMPYPGLSRLIEPFGNFSQMGVLWASIGASPSYERFGGFAELAAGVLLLFPRTTLLGALVAAADMTQVFMLNMTYDVPVKIFSFHLLLLSLFLVAPDLPRILTLFFRNKPVPAPAPALLFRSRRAARIALAVQLLYGAALLGFGIRDSWKNWYEFGGGAPKPPLYGIWEVDEYSIDGKALQPIVTEKDRWRRLVIESPRLGSLQLMDDSLAFYSPALDLEKHTLILTTRRQKDFRAQFSFEQSDPNRLTLDGDMNSHKIHAQLHLFDDSKKFPLREAKFHWINESPVNR